MAGTATSRGVPRQITQGRLNVPVIGAGEIPRIQFSSGSARALEAFARDMFQVSDGFQDQLDQQAEAEGAVSGAMAGMQGEPELQDYGTIRGRAFNRAAIETFVTTLETQSIFKVQELTEKYGSDPARLQQELEAYGAGVSQEVGKVYAPAAAAIQQRLAIRAVPAVEAAKDARYKLTRDAADAALIENEVALKAEINEHAADLFSDNPARSEAAARAVGILQGEYLKIFEAVDPTTGKPLYSQEERAKARVAFRDTVFENASLSWFDQQPNKAEAYQKFIDGDFKIKLGAPAADPKGRVVMANKGKIRGLPITADVQGKLAVATAAMGPNVVAKVTSGGQPTKGMAALTGARRKGSTRHDDGKSADVVLVVDGKEVTPMQNPALYEKFLENAAAAGFTGIGHYAWGVHVGGGSVAAWGPNTKSDTLAPRYAAAIERGRKGPRLQTDPVDQEIDVRKALPDVVMNRIDAEMRSRITFRNSMADRVQDQQEKALKAQQEAREFELTNRLYSEGASDPETGQPLAPLSREEIAKAVRRNEISPSAGEAMAKALATEKPEKSDAGTYRDMLARVYAGEDIYRAVLENGNRLSASDTKELLGLNQSQVRNDAGTMNKDQEFHYNNLKDLLTPDSMMAKLDEGAEDRKYLALDEYRRRVLDEGENARDVAMDLRDRAKLTFETMTASKLDAMPRPRFYVPGARPGLIDLKATALALQTAFREKNISAAEFERQKRALKDWADLQSAVERQGTKAK